VTGGLSKVVLVSPLKEYLASSVRLWPQPSRDRERPLELQGSRGRDCYERLLPIKMEKDVPTEVLSGGSPIEERRACPRSPPQDL
jgi:hypothetical protein